MDKNAHPAIVVLSVITLAAMFGETIYAVSRYLLH
jgi:hypothetical protein